MTARAPAPAARSYGPAEAALLLGLAGMWGLSFLFIEVALRGLTPLWVVASRTGIGALALLIAVAVRGGGLPDRARLWGQVLLLGVINNAIPWGTIAWAQQTLPSGLTALLMAVVPTSTMLVSAAVGLERLTAWRIVGLAGALGGVALTVASDASDPGRLLAVLAVLGATLCYAAGAVYAKRRLSGRAPALTIAVGQVASAFLVTGPLALLADGLPAAGGLTPPVLASAIALGALGTGVAFLIFYTLIERVGATNTTMVTYLIPLVAVVAGVVVLGERLAPLAIVGGLLIVVGVYVAQRATAPGEDPVTTVGTAAPPAVDEPGDDRDGRQ